MEQTQVTVISKMTVTLFMERYKMSIPAHQNENTSFEGTKPDIIIPINCNRTNFVAYQVMLGCKLSPRFFIIATGSFLEWVKRIS